MGEGVAVAKLGAARTAGREMDTRRSDGGRGKRKSHRWGEL